MKKRQGNGWFILAAVLFLYAFSMIFVVLEAATGESFTVSAEGGTSSPWFIFLIFDALIWWAAIAALKKGNKLSVLPKEKRPKKKKWKWRDAVSIDVVDYGIRHRHNLTRHGLSALFGGIFLGTYGIARANHKHGGVDVPYAVFELTYPDGSTELVKDDADGGIYSYMVDLMEELEAKQEAAEAEDFEVIQEPISVEESTAQNRPWGMPDAVSITFVGHQQTQKKVRFFLTYPDGTTEEVIADNHGALYRYLMNRKAELEKKQ